jgi:hypothetical protein
LFAYLPPTTRTNFCKNLSDVDLGDAGVDAATTTYAGGHSKLFHEALLLVVISITDTIRAFRTCVLFPGNPGKISKKTGVPASYTLPTFSGQIGFVVDIEAGTGWADHAASTTSETGISQIFPGWTVLFKA